jgi:hypothetical protein
MTWNDLGMTSCLHFVPIPAVDDLRKHKEKSQTKLSLSILVILLYLCIILRSIFAFDAAGDSLIEDSISNTGIRCRFKIFCEVVNGLL